MGAPQRILDPAAGRGEFITAVPAAERWGVDLVSQGDLEAAGVKMIIADIMDAELPEGYFDGVFLSNFLEHLPDQNAVAAVLGKLHAAMAPGGRIAIMGPNFRYCPREYFDCADHTVILTHVSVAEHLYAAGFDIDAAGRGSCRTPSGARCRRHPADQGLPPHAGAVAAARQAVPRDRP